MHWICRLAGLVVLSAVVRTAASGQVVGIQGLPFDRTQPQAGQVWRFHNGAWRPHSLAVSDISGLQSVLDGKAAVSHAHLPQDLQSGGAQAGQVLKWNGSAWAPANDETGLGSVSWGMISGLITDQSDLAAALQSKASVSHVHQAGDITGGLLDPARLGSGQPSSSVFLRGDSSWSAIGWNDVSGKPDSYPPSAHGHSLADISGLAAELANKAPLTHQHDAADIASGLISPARLGSSAPSGSKFLRGDQTWAEIDWTKIAGKPDSFPPSAHTHAPSDLQPAGAQAGQVLKWNGSAWAPAQDQTGLLSVSWGQIQGTLSDQADLASALAAKADAVHQHSATDLSSGLVPTARLGSGSASSSTFLRGDQAWASVGWQDVVGKPSSFPPSSHTHAADDITSGLIGTARLGSGTPTSWKFLRGDQQWVEVDWSQLTGKPSSFPPSAHTHALADLQQGGASTGQVLAWNGSAWAPTTLQAGTGPTPFQSVWSSFTASSNARYRIAANNLTVTLPASPSDGDWVELVGSGITGTVVNRNGKSIMGLVENMTIDVPNFAIRLVYIAPAGDWMIAP